jgi:hypothetical protein
VKKRRNGRIQETAILPKNRKKALKSKAQERGKLKEAFKRWKPETAERVAKP